MCVSGRTQSSPLNQPSNRSDRFDQLTAARLSFAGQARHGHTVAWKRSVATTQISTCHRHITQAVKCIEWNVQAEAHAHYHRSMDGLRCTDLYAAGSVNDGFLQADAGFHWPPRTLPIGARRRRRRWPSRIVRWGNKWKRKRENGQCCKPRNKSGSIRSLEITAQNYAELNWAPYRSAPAR